MNEASKDFVFYEDYRKWEEDVKGRGLILVTVSNGMNAQDKITGTCKGFWGRSVKKGWVANAVRS